MKVRVGNLSIPVAQVRKNPYTTGGYAAPDDRFSEMLRYLDAGRSDAQFTALSDTSDPDTRAKALGKYHAFLMIRKHFLTLYETSTQNAGESEGEQING